MFVSPLTFVHGRYHCVCGIVFPRMDPRLLPMVLSWGDDPSTHQHSVAALGVGIIWSDH